MFAIAALLTLPQSVDDGLSLREIVANLPADPASIAAILLLIVSLVVVLWTGTRPRGKGGTAA